MDQDKPKTVGECWEIMERHGIKRAHLDAEKFSTAGAILRLENRINELATTAGELVYKIRAGLPYSVKPLERAIDKTMEGGTVQSAEK